MGRFDRVLQAPRGELLTGAVADPCHRHALAADLPAIGVGRGDPASAQHGVCRLQPVGDPGLGGVGIAGDPLELRGRDSEVRGLGMDHGEAR
jgi:hypothetical protein